MLIAPLLALTLAQAQPAATPQLPPRPDAAPAAVTTAPAPAADDALPPLGLSLETSVPEGVTLSLMYRPIPRIRLWAGPAWNYVAWGVQGGAGVALANWGVTPVLSVEAARFFGADLSFMDVPAEMEPLLADVSMTYAAGHLGLEMGSPRGFSFAVRLGLAWFRARTRGEGRVDDDGSTVVFRDPRFNATSPSLKLGFNYWF